MAKLIAWLQAARSLLLPLTECLDPFNLLRCQAQRLAGQRLSDVPVLRQEATYSLLVELGVCLKRQRRIRLGARKP